MNRTALTTVVCVWAALIPAAPARAQSHTIPFPDPSGVIGTVGSVDLSNPFFQNLGTNGRVCATCHQFSDGMTVTPPHLRARFLISGGTDPIFRPVDGANCDSLDVSTRDARRSAYSLLLSKGLIRIALPVPENAEFTVIAVDNPYGCSSTTTLSMYRRPLPATNLRFLTTVMWDGRESIAGNTLQQNLMHQANSATTGHAQGAPIDDATAQQIVAFEIGLHTAQMAGLRVGSLSSGGASGGPAALALQPFFVGINDPLGTAPFDPSAFGLFSAWANAHGEDAALRQSIARGETIFNTRPIAITGVAGLNDKLGVAALAGTCTTCHNAPNVGDHSVALPIDIGVNDPSRRTPDLPLFTIQNNTTFEVVQTLDPARALVTGKWADIGKMKGPILRGLAARAPYFHNGSAATLLDAVNFYDTRFQLGLTDQEKADLVNFLSSL